MRLTWNWRGLWAALIASWMLVAPAHAEFGATPSNQPPDGLLVKFKSTASAATRLRALKAAGCSHVASFGIVPGLTHASITSGASVATTIQLLKANPNVEFVEENSILTIMATPNDPQFGALYGLNNTGQTGGVADADIDAPEAWDLTTGSNNIVVAVIDTGVAYTHPDLAANIWTNPGEIAGNGIDDDRNGYIDDIRGWDFANNDNNPMDDNRHGTHVSGTIAAVGNNGLGVVGVNWRARIMPLKFLTATGSGSTANGIAAINYAVRNGAKIINASWGGGASSQAMLNAINAANAAGVLFVAAAGNAGTNNDTVPSYPASYNAPNIVAVAASDSGDARAGFSNFGPTSVDVAAPGVGILSTVLNNGYATLSGTSMATPHVSGVAALVLAANPTLSVAALKNAIMNTVDRLGPWTGVIVSGGRVNARAAVASVAGAAPPAPAPAALTVTPQTAVRAVGTSLQISVSGGTAPYVWSSSNTAMTISGTGNVATLASNVAGTTTVTVRDATNATASTGTITFRSVSVTAPSTSVNVGATLQLTASNGRTPYSWTVSNNGVATINATTGLLTGVTAGQTVVNATDADNITGSTTITVVAPTPPPAPTLPALTPTTGLLGPGATATFTVSGGTAPYTWSTSNSAVASITPLTATTARLTAIAAGSITVTVRDANNNSATSGTITVRSVTVTQTGTSVNVGGTLQFAASGGRAPYTWSTSNSAVATITSAGTLTGVAAGSVTVRAVDADGFFGTSALITVLAATPPPATGMSITPQTAIRATGTSLQLSVSGGTAPYTWSSSNTAMTISGTGASATLTSAVAGQTVITVRDAANRTATTGTITFRAVVVSGGTSVTTGSTLQLTASGGRAPYTWLTGNSGVATVSATGVVTGIAAGTATITATDADGIAGATTISVTAAAPPVVNITVSPSTGSLTVGGTLQFAATGGTAPYSWSVNGAAATISSTGLLTGVSAGAVTVTVMDAGGNIGSSGTIDITAPAPPPTPTTPLTITPTTATVAVGSTLLFSASGGTGSYTWVVNGTGATISATGLLLGTAAGTVTVTATDTAGNSGTSGTVTITAAPAGGGGGGGMGGGHM